MSEEHDEKNNRINDLEAIIRDKDDIISQKDEELVQKNNLIAQQYKDIAQKDEKILRLTTGNTPSKYERAVKSNDRYRQENAQLRADNKLKDESIKSLSNDIDELKFELSYHEAKKKNYVINNFAEIKFPGVNHFVFNYLFELINDYPDKKYIQDLINEWIDNKLEPLEKLSHTDEDNLEIFTQIDELIREEKNNGAPGILAQKRVFSNEEYKGYKAQWRAYNKNRLKHQQQTHQHQEEIKLLNNWKDIPNHIDTTNTYDLQFQDEVKIKNIMNELEECYEDIKNNVSFNNFHIICETKNKDTRLGEITNALEQQLHLSFDDSTQIAYVSDGRGRMQILDKGNENNIYATIQKGIYCMAETKDNIMTQPAIWFNKKDLFELVPRYIKRTIRPDKTIVGFNNGFFNAKNYNTVADVLKHGQVEKLDAKYPRLPFKNTNTSLVLADFDTKPPIAQVLETCFTKKDQDLILGYLGCALYDIGFSQHQELLYIMGLGGVGKSTFARALCGFFNRVENIGADKISVKNDFGFAQLVKADFFIIDELTVADDSFTEKIKEITGGGDIPIEQKHIDAYSLAVDQIPRCIILGNNLPPNIYKKAESPGILRRIIPIIPIKNFLDCGYLAEDLNTEECKEWLVQQATLKYIELKWHKDQVPIISNHKQGEGILTADEIMDRLFRLTYPEQYMLDKHFEIQYIDDNQIDVDVGVYSKDLYTFINKEIKQAILEPTISSNLINWETEVQKAFELKTTTFSTRRNNKTYYCGIVPKSDKAIEFFADMED